MLCCCYANLRFIEDHNLVTKTEIIGGLFFSILESILEEHSDKILGIYGRGLMATLHLGNNKDMGNAHEMANKFVAECVKNGLILYTPCGPYSANIKLVPPLTINEDDLVAGCQIIRNVLSYL